MAWRGSSRETRHARTWCQGSADTLDTRTSPASVAHGPAPSEGADYTYVVVSEVYLNLIKF